MSKEAQQEMDAFLDEQLYRCAITEAEAMWLGTLSRVAQEIARLADAAEKILEELSSP